MKRQAKHQNQTCRDVGIIKAELKTTVINMLRALMDKVDGIKNRWSLYAERDENSKKKKCQSSKGL